MDTKHIKQTDCSLKLYWSQKKIEIETVLEYYIPIATYGCEVRVLKVTTKNKLMVFERKVLRKIFGPTEKSGGTWGIKTKDEVDELIRHKNTINHMKAQRLSWFGHLHRMVEERMVKKVYKWKPMSIRPQGRPKNRREDDIRNDKKKLKIKNCISCIQDSNKWKSYVERAKHSEMEVLAPKEEEEEEERSMPLVTDERPSLVQWMNDDRRKLKYSEKNLSQCHFVHHKSHTNWPGIDPGPLR